jgi:DNA polymerase-3 subunit gamma/tau
MFIFKATRLIVSNDITNCLLLFDEILNQGFNGQHFIDGLCLHFRDLLISKSLKTHVLLNQNENLKDRYVDQSKNLDIDFILKSINLTEECSFKYKNSKNQRLLTEICLMKLCSINNIELKKKVKILSRSELAANNTSYKADIHSPKENLKTNILDKEYSKEKLKIKKETSPVSGLSLSSLKAKKNIESIALLKKNESESSSSNKTKFDVNSLSNSWKKFQELTVKKGRKNLASILSISQPQIFEENKLTYTLTNNTNKLELEKSKLELVEFLKKDLKNDSISLEINVNKLKEKKFVFTPGEKYEKLKKINPNIEILRKEFKLNL